MSTAATSDLSYPIGRFTPPAEHTPEQRAADLRAIAELPARLRDAVAGLDDARLDTPYRPGGWTVRQLVHHIADSHMNAFVRLKLGLTEEAPTIKPYEEARWAELADGRLPVDLSLALLDALHARWAALLQAMTPADFARIVHHPEHAQPMSLDRLTAQYAWHSRHHVAHVTALREREGF